MSDLMLGVYLMIIGIGVVFAFLIILVIGINLNAKLIEWLNKVYPEKEETAQPKARENDFTEIAVAIAAAKLYNK